MPQNLHRFLTEALLMPLDKPLGPLWESLASDPVRQRQRPGSSHVAEEKMLRKGSVLWVILGLGVLKSVVRFYKALQGLVVGA